jgi:hypothetical protein
MEANLFLQVERTGLEREFPPERSITEYVQGEESPGALGLG